MHQVSAERGTTPVDPAAEAVDPELEVRALVVRSQKGDANAFGLLYDQFLPEIVR